MFPFYGMIPMVLSRLNISILRTKFSQDLTFIKIMYGAMNEIGFRFALSAIYISFSVLASALFRRRASIRQGEFSSLITSVTSKIGIFPGRFLIRRFYYISVNRFCDFHTLKYINILFKLNRSATKALNIGLFRPYNMHAD